MLKCGIFLILLAPLLATTAARGGDATTQNTADLMSTPKGTLRYSDRTVPESGFDGALAFYHAGNPQEQLVARAMAEVDVAAGKLQRLLEARYDKPTVATLMHAMRNETADDIDAADETITGDKAVVAWKDGRDPVPMVKVQGVWLVDVSDICKDFDQDNPAADFIQLQGHAAQEFTRLARELTDGEYANAALLERAIKRRMNALLGEE